MKKSRKLSYIEELGNVIYWKVEKQNIPPRTVVIEEQTPVPASILSPTTTNKNTKSRFKMRINFRIMRRVPISHATIREIGVDIRKGDVLYLSRISKNPHRLHAYIE